MYYASLEYEIFSVMVIVNAKEPPPLRILFQIDFKHQVVDLIQRFLKEILLSLWLTTDKLRSPETKYQPSPASWIQSEVDYTLKTCKGVRN